MNTPAQPWKNAAAQAADTTAEPVPDVSHYENFPVGSLLLPRRLRPAVFAIYHFARHADDIADEGDASQGQRLAQLRALHRQLEQAASGLPAPSDDSGPLPAVVARLIEPVRRHRLGWRHFHDLLDAFEQDLIQGRYTDAAAVDHYCERSANPVGRLMLELFESATPANVAAGDAICSALQRINFLQDIGIDMAKDRIYMPLATLHDCGLDAAGWQQQIGTGQLDARARDVVRRECHRAREQMLAGRALLPGVPLRLRLELRAIMAGGLRVLDRIASADHDPVARRPRLGWPDALPLIWLALTLGRQKPPTRPS